MTKLKKVIKKSWKYVLLIIWVGMMISFISQTAQAFSSRNYDMGGDMLIVSMLWIYVLISKLNEYELNKSIMIKNEIIDTQDTTINELIKSRDRIMNSVKTVWEDE
jgi:high-affinity K+ transport system ATPase subunit B